MHFAYCFHDRITKGFKGNSLYGIVANMLVCEIILNEFKLKSCYFIQFQITTLCYIHLLFFLFLSIWIDSLVLYLGLFWVVLGLS